MTKIKETKNWFFGKINKTDKPLARLIKNNREMNQINKLRNEKRRGYNRKCRNTKDYEIIMNSYVAIKWITWKKWTDS